MKIKLICMILILVIVALSLSEALKDKKVSGKLNEFDWKFKKLNYRTLKHQVKAKLQQQKM